MEDVLNYTKDDSEDFYAILGCDPSATEEQIISEYRARVIECHPDKNPDDPQAAARFQLLQRAKDVLSDPSTRVNYDRWRRSQLAISYQQWCNMAPTHRSTHWACSKPQPMLHDTVTSSENQPHTPTTSSTNTTPKWKQGFLNLSITASVPITNIHWFRDSPSDMIQKFRNYEI
ncbi:hypothetical protein LOTGIDRAFT_177577 [Lottia gigantea]|uniref:J domain-containing protein n=1 Tax=Lottia gigantea TaxID=225164 RepID=V4B6E3_LOTGI|nr:hypothetical protein LOTGIDRAFT_177577 [Lottia gigantea]ESO84089.1 hypothetical protein LOTGIDRAFT_177577 [Lottia gigantea]